MAITDAIHIGDDNSFLFFFRYIHRYEISLASNFDHLLHHQLNRSVEQGKASFDDEIVWACFNIFTKYALLDTYVHFFWYVCVMYYTPLDDLRRFFAWLRIGFWKAQEGMKKGQDALEFSHDDMLKLDKKELLIEIKKFVDGGPTHLACFLHGMVVFF